MGKYVRKTLEQMELDSYERANTENMIVEEINEEEYLVTNLDHQSIYKVFIDGDIIIDCECPHHRFRNVQCKHMVVVSQYTGKAV